MERGRAPTPEEGYPVEWEVLKAGALFVAKIFRPKRNL